jgi:hypothetical protein
MIALWSDWLRLVVLAGFVESLAQHQQAVGSMAFFYPNFEVSGY